MRFDVLGKIKGRLPKRQAAIAAEPTSVPDPVPPSAPASEAGDIDLRAIGQKLLARKRFILIPTLLAAILSTVAVNMITPRYKSEARILIDGRENVFLRPNGERNEERSALDPEAVASQVQLLLSRDLARQVIKKNKLAELPEFDPVLRGVSPVRSLLGLLGILRDPLRMTPEERVMDSYYSRLTAYAVDKSRVVVVEFQSQDPGSRGACRQFDCRRLSGSAAGCAAAAGQGGWAVAVRRDRWSAQEGRGCGIARGSLPIQVEPVRRHQQYDFV